MRRIAGFLAAWLLIAAAGADGIRLPPIDHAATLKECGACHLAYPPQMLPARSWGRIMDSLADHFGEDASLGEIAHADIAAYLRANAADSPGAVGGKHFMRRLDPAQAPLRITESPWWQRAHDEIAPARFASEKVKSRANCAACHRTAEKGEFFEEEED